MKRDDIIRMAREAGLAALLRDTQKTHEALERFAALVAAASEEKWKHAVINELVCCHIYNAAHDSDPRKALHDAISWNVQVALDPKVSSDAQALIDRGAAAEREACAKVCSDRAMRCESEAQRAIESGEHDEVSAIRSTAWQISVCAAAIRARSST